MEQRTMVQVVPYSEGRHTEAARRIWNEVVAAGDAFPQEEPLQSEAARAFFAGQSHVGVAEADGRVVGLYVLHPNNVGRCGHIANASYAVAGGQRGRRVGRALVQDSLRVAARLGFGIMQFNAVVAGNTAAIRLYEQLGFVRLGTVPGGFRLGPGGGAAGGSQNRAKYTDIILFYRTLADFREDADAR